MWGLLIYFCQAGWGSGQPGLVVGDPAHSRGVETGWSWWSFSTQAILWFCDSMMIPCLCTLYLRQEQTGASPSPFSDEWQFFRQNEMVCFKTTRMVVLCWEELKNARERWGTECVQQILIDLWNMFLFLFSFVFRKLQLCTKEMKE